MDAMTVLSLAAGLALLVIGAEALVRGSAGLAARLGVPPLLAGLTIVAWGTSSPELAVSVGAALRGQGDLAVGNVIGSNVFNVLFILGVSALITPLVVSRQLVRLDVPVMVGVALLVPALAADGRVSPLDGAVLLAGLLLYTALLLRLGRKDAAGTEASPGRLDPLALQLVLVVAGLALLVLGSRWMVAGAVALARALGLSELIIGLTIVAAGTSLPEVASSVVAALRGQRDIAVGNVVGSNIFNVLGVLGLTALSGGGLAVTPSALAFDVPVMIAVAVACLPIFFTGHLIARWEGALFLAYYLAYVSFLILDARDHELLPLASRIMLGFVVPLTAVTLTVLTARALRAARR